MTLKLGAEFSKLLAKTSRMVACSSWSLPRLAISPTYFCGTGKRPSSRRKSNTTGRIYQVQELPASIVQATRLPREPVGYGTIQQLFTELARTFEEYLPFRNSGEADYLLGSNHLAL